MLEQLLEYARKEGLDAKPGFAPKDVRWTIVCDDVGKFLDVIEIGDTEKGSKNKGQNFKKCPDLTQSELVSGKEIKCHFLVETAGVITLLGAEDNDEKIKLKHDYFIKLAKDAGEMVPEIELAAECLLNLETLNEINNTLMNQKAKPTDKITFKIGDSYLVERDDWHEWWCNFRDVLNKKDEKILKTKKKKDKEVPNVKMRCFATGELAEPVKTHPKIKGLSDVGGIMSGDVLIGFDKDAFSSYALSQSKNAAISEQATAEYTIALNDLIKENSKRFVNAKVLHWFKNKIDPKDDPLFFLEQGEDQDKLEAQNQVKKLLESIKTGERVDLSMNHYYAITLSGASGRVMIRDWMEGQFEELIENINFWFDDLTIVHREGGNRLAPNPKFLAVLGSLARKDSQGKPRLDDLPAPFVSKMWRVAVKKEPIPYNALSQALIRTKVDIIQDNPFIHARMGLMKAYHVRKNRLKGGNSMSDIGPYLNENHPEPAYQCGRLMAVFARLQRSALGDVGAGVVQRYYAAASSTPALILGRLTRNCQHHLNKLDGGLVNWYEDKIGNIWSRIKDKVPKTLTLEEQSLFALGYYQQIAQMRTKKTENTSQEKEDNNE